MFPYADVIHSIVSHIDPEAMILRNVSAERISSFRIEDYHEIYHFPFPMSRMDVPFYTPNGITNTRDILKHWVKEPTKLGTTSNQIYMTKTLRSAYQFLFIFACHLYGQGSTKTFPQSWVAMLDQLENKGKPFNQSNTLAFQLKVHLSNAQSPPKDQ